MLRIRSEDTIGFLYELSSALRWRDRHRAADRGVARGTASFDTLHVTDGTGEKITDPIRQRELRARDRAHQALHAPARSPNPEAAPPDFRDFLGHLFQQPDWLHELASLERSDVLTALRGCSA